MKKSVNLFLILFLALAVSNYASASFSVGNASHSIEKKYAPNATITGWINISLNNEPANSLFNSNLGGSASLTSILDSNSFQKDLDYFCTPSDCMSDYAPVSGSNGETKEFSLFAEVYS